MYRLLAYYLARSIADIPIEMINTFLFTIITYWLGGLTHSAAEFFRTAFSLLLVTLVAEAWGLFVGGTFMDPKSAQVRGGRSVHPRRGGGSCSLLGISWLKGGIECTTINLLLTHVELQSFLILHQKRVLAAG
jgi:hypothetical protein